MLVVESRGGRVFEAARGPGGDRIVWEYVNLQEGGFISAVSGAQRVGPDELTFLDKSCARAAPGDVGSVLIR